MATHDSPYVPLLLDKVSLSTLQSPQYRRFIQDTAVVSGIRLLLARHRRRPDWPYVDTKFNPNTGEDLGESSYRRIFAWFLGRGSEALQGHLARLAQMESLGQQERRETEEVFTQQVVSMTDAILKTTALNSDRCPFRLNRKLQAIDEDGRRIDVDGRISSAGDSFCAKGLIATGNDTYVRQGMDMLMRTAANIRAKRYGVDQFKEQPKDISQGSRMLTLGAVSLLYRRSSDAALRARMLAVAEEFLAYVLDKHYDAESTVFSEYVDAQTEKRKAYLDPGHATEFVGLGLGAAACLELDTASLTPQRRALLDRVYRDMPPLLLSAARLGWNRKHPGLFKAVDTQTHQVLNEDMPWWNLPETMRAAAWCAKVTREEKTRQECLELLARCHNAYFRQYPNPANMLFPFQTLSGTTGKVVDKVPAVPEGDPLYHTNLALLEMLDVIQTL
jgi:mannose/cellobiose epimerase-like protein (N-acyl-D-glucosamine 2-epimerase family)